MQNNSVPSPADLPRRHNAQKLRKMVAEDALNLRSIRAAGVPTYSVGVDGTHHDLRRPARVRPQSTNDEDFACNE